MNHAVDAHVVIHVSAFSNQMIELLHVIQEWWSLCPFLIAYQTLVEIAFVTILFNGSLTLSGAIHLSLE
jgi:hypothetical protein